MIVKVDIKALRRFLLFNGGVGELDEKNFQEKAELISMDSTEAVIQFHRQTDFDFKYRIPLEFIQF